MEKTPLDMGFYKVFGEHTVNNSSGVANSISKQADKQTHTEEPEQLIRDLRSDLKQSEKERFSEIQRAVDWRTKFLAAEREVIRVGIDNANLKTEIRKMNILLEQAHKDRQTCKGVMRMLLASEDAREDLANS